MKKLIYGTLAILLSVGCPAAQAQKKDAGPIDKKATKETAALYKKLASRKPGMLFGTQSTNVTGSHFDAIRDNLGVDSCDVYTAVGDYPVVFNYDFIDGFSTLLPFVRKAASLGAVVSICYHINGPDGDYQWGRVTDLKRRDVAQVLPGGAKHDYLLGQLDSIAVFANNATFNGVKIPIIFRPWHEHTGGWFWWGSSSCTEEEFVDLWRFTVTYLRDVKKVDNLLYAFSPSRPADFNGYETRNPGPGWFDVAGFDCYGADEFTDKMLASAKETAEYAKKHGKIAALTEFGYRKGLRYCENPDWFTKAFLGPLAESGLLKEFSYASTWRNTPAEFWIPLPDKLQYADFVRFHNDGRAIFLKKYNQSK